MTIYDRQNLVIQDEDGNINGLLAFSDIFDVVKDSTGVRRLSPVDGDFTLNGDHADITLSRKEFPRLGTVTLVDGDTSQPL